MEIDIYIYKIYIYIYVGNYRTGVVGSTGLEIKPVGLILLP